MTYAMMICRDTEREAQEVRREILEKCDWGAATNIMKVLGIESGSFPHMEAFRERFILGWGGLADRPPARACRRSDKRR